jgi:hypothetical protein
MYHLYFNKNLLWEIVLDAFGPNWDYRKESRYVSFLFLTKTFSEKSFQTLSDRIETVGKNRFLPLSWIFLLRMNNFGKTFSEKSFQTISDQIESVGKNCFLPLSFKNKYFFYIYKYLLKEVKSRWFGTELSLVGMNCFLPFPVGNHM